jgi:HK97 gp10 family phage protein
MAGTSVEVLNVERLRRRLARMSDAVTRHAREAIAQSAEAIETDAKQSIERGPKTGRLYERSDPRRSHRASAPGQAPATDSGRLGRNITHVVDPDGLGASVESRATHSRALEFGTTDMAARPFMHPAFERNRSQIRRMLGRAVATAIKAAR